MIDKGMYGAAQPEIAPYYIENIPIPNYSNLFQSSIESVYKKANDKINYSKDLYIKSEQDLLQALGISNWQPTEETKSIKRFSKSYAISGRLDAEYYQPKFDEVLEVIGKVKHKTLGSIASFKKSIEPGSDAYQTEGIPFIRVSDISKFGISQPEIHLDPKIYNDETLKPKKDTILLSKDGSVGIAYKVEQDLDVITSSALLHLTIKDKEVLPDYLTLVLNSKLTQMQAERDAGGSIIQHWRPDEIKQVLIPILPMDTQKELANQIQQSFKLRQESSKLIDIAKQAVEIAIEQDEQTAMKFIKDNT
jgi:restriction endonuclease S subunit